MLTEQPLGLQRNLIRRAMERLHPQDPDVSYATLERASNFIASQDGNRRVRTDLSGGVHLLREGRVDLCSREQGNPSRGALAANAGYKRYPAVEDPHAIALSGGWKLNCERWNIASLALEQARTNHDPFQTWVDANGIAEALELRVRQEGDRFEPLGMDGHEMKLSDFFINVKLPQRARDRWPLLCMGEKVVWVPGYRPAHSFRVTDTTRQALYFSMTRLKNSC